MHQHEMEQSNVYLGIYTIEYYFLLEKSGCYIKTVEKELQVVQCNNRGKVLLASHQLIGPTADWWDAYVEAHEEPNTINWNEFKMAF
jgi:hypothetical protein